MPRHPSVTPLGRWQNTPNLCCSGRFSIFLCYCSQYPSSDTCWPASLNESMKAGRDRAFMFRQGDSMATERGLQGQAWAEDTYSKWDEECEQQSEGQGGAATSRGCSGDTGVHRGGLGQPGVRAVSPDWGSLSLSISRSLHSITPPSGLHLPPDGPVGSPAWSGSASDQSLHLLSAALTFSIKTVGLSLT